MTTLYTCLTVLVLGFCSTTSGFFLNWGAQEPVTQPHYYYHQRLLSAPNAYNVPGVEPAPQAVPAIPIQVPLHAQLSPTATVQNVQLVPCLCPISQELEYEKVVPSGETSLHKVIT